MAQFQMEYSEQDWGPESGLLVGPYRVRVWPGTDPVQSQWAAVDLWMGLRGVSGAEVSPVVKQKASFEGVLLQPQDYRIQLSTLKMIDLTSDLYNLTLIYYSNLLVMQCFWHVDFLILFFVNTSVPAH